MPKIIAILKINEDKNGERCVKFPILRVFNICENYCLHFAGVQNSKNNMQSS
jgi:hypothetical protein